jgi:hypothetical protein
MQNISITGTAKRMQKRRYKSKNGSGEFVSILVSDSTATINLTLWGKELQKLGDIKESDFIRVQGYVRQGLLGPELRLGNFGKIEKMKEQPSNRAVIASLQEGQKVELRASILQIFESNPFYEVCPKCNISLKESNSEYTCLAHGKVEPIYTLRISGVIDDGSAPIRAVFFKDQAEKILGISAKEAQEIVLHKGISGLLSQARFREWIFEGRIKQNKLFGNKEMIVSSIKELDILKEADYLLQQEEKLKQA